MQETASTSFPLRRLAALALLCSLIVMLGRMEPRTYDSDYLYLPSLFQDLAQGGRLADWNLSPAPYLVPDMLLYGLADRAVDNFHLALLLYGIAQSMLFLAGWLWLAWLMPGIGVQERQARQALLLAVASLLLLLPAFGEWVQAQFLSVNHFGVLVAMPHTVALLWLTMGGRGWARYLSGVGLFGLVLVMILSDSLYIFQVVLPLLAALLLDGTLRPTWQRRSAAGALLVAGVGAGLLLARVLLPPSNAFLLAQASLEGSWQSLRLLAHWLRGWGATHGGAAFLLLGSYLFLLHVGWHTLRAPDGQARQFKALLLLLVLLSGPLSLIAVVGAGIFYAPASARYLQVFGHLPLYVVPLLIPLSSPRAAGRARVMRPLVVGALLPLAVAALLSAPRLARLTSVYPARVACLDRELAARGVRVGIAHYWDARYTTMLSQEGLQLLQVTPELLPYFWVSNVQWYHVGAPTFALVADGASSDAVHLSDAVVTERFGPPSERVACPGVQALIYDRPEDSAFQAFLQQVPLVALAVEGASYRFAAAELPGQVGAVEGTARVADPGETGYLSFGPYVSLAAGTYRATLHYQAVAAAQPLGHWDIMAAPLAGQARPLMREPLHAGQAAQADFTLRGLSVVEVRLFSDGVGSLRLDQLEIQRLP